MNIDLLLNEIEEFSFRENFPIVGAEKGKFLAECIKKYQPKNILEVGSLIGYSAIWMGRELSSEAKITTLEFNPKAGEKARENIEKAGLSDKIKVITGRAQDIIPALNEIFDLVFIDAEKAEYYEIFKIIEPKLSQKAIVIADNVGNFKYKMKNFLDYIRNNPNYKNTLYNFDFDEMEISEKL